jgi:hypothetical protein
MHRRGQNAILGLHVQLGASSQWVMRTMPMATPQPKSGDCAAEVTTPTCFLPAISGHQRSQGGTPSAVDLDGADLLHRAFLGHAQQRVAPDTADGGLRCCRTGPARIHAACCPASCRCRSSASPPSIRSISVGAARACTSRSRPPPSARSTAACRYRALDIDLEAALFRIARARDHQVAALEIEMPKRKKRMSRTASPKTRAIRSSAFGPCTASGETSGSSTSTSRR